MKYMDEQEFDLEIKLSNKVYICILLTLISNSSFHVISQSFMNFKTFFVNADTSFYILYKRTHIFRVESRRVLKINCITQTESGMLVILCLAVENQNSSQFIWNSFSTVNLTVNLLIPTF